MNISYEGSYSGLVPFYNGVLLFVFRKPQTTDSYYFCSRYADAKNSGLKSIISDEFKIRLDKNWHWHHIIEKTHLKPLFSELELSNFYQNVIPCVLIHYEVHNYYNGLHGRGSKVVFDLPNSSTVLDNKGRVNYITNLKKLYSEVYRDDRILWQISMNILNKL